MWNQRSDKRLSEWKQFRKSLDDMSIEDAVKATTHLWSYAPFVNHYLVADSTEEWPDPWTLLDENYYCDIAKALGMLYTLGLSKHGKEIDLELKILVDRNGNLFNLVYIDQGKYIINYWHDEVVNSTDIDKELKIKYSYSTYDLKLHTY